MPATYLSTLGAFTSFLTAYIHTLLYLRTLYPRTSFVHSRFHNTSVFQSRHPLVCEWIRDAVDAVREELLVGSVARIGIAIFSYESTGDDGGTGSAKILERYMFDVSRFPVVTKEQRALDIEWEADSPPDHDDQAHPPKHPLDLDAEADANLSEQFRAALITLTTRACQLSPLPPHCSFNVSLELKDEGDVDPPIGHPMPWVPVQPSLQKTGRKGREGAETKTGKESEGRDLGGVKVTAIRSVEAGVFRFETWIEEGRAKFEGQGGETKEGDVVDGS